MAIKSQVVIWSLKETSLISPTSPTENEIFEVKSRSVEIPFGVEEFDKSKVGHLLAKCKFRHQKNIKKDKKTSFTSTKLVYFTCKLFFPSSQCCINWLVSCRDWFVYIHPSWNQWKVFGDVKWKETRHNCDKNQLVVLTLSAEFRNFFRMFFNDK